jgi:hypothetical protein
MNGTTLPRDPDAILAAWLEEGPNQLPNATRRAIAVGLRSTRQTRRARRVPRLPNVMHPFARIAVAAAAIVIVAGGAFYLLSPSNEGVLGPPPTASRSPSAAPTVAPSATDGASAAPGAWKSFRSRRFQYRLEVPAGWVHSIPVDDLPDDLFPGEEAQFADRWDEPVLRTPYVIVAVIQPAPGSIADWRDRRLSQLTADCDASDPIEISIAGTTGERRSATCQSGRTTEIVLFVIAERVYAIETSAIAEDAATGRAVLDHVLETFEHVSGA